MGLLVVLQLFKNFCQIKEMEENIGILGVDGGRQQPSQKQWPLCTSQDASTRKTTNALKRVKSVIKTIQDKGICLKKEIETWVVLSFVSPNPIVSLAETETTHSTYVPSCSLCISFDLLYTSRARN